MEEALGLTLLKTAFAIELILIDKEILTALILIR
jgi:hypothetical protein